MASSSLSRAIEVTVTSGENLRLNRKPVKKNSFVIVRTESQGYGVTDIDVEGGSYPFWNKKFVLDLPPYSTFLTAEVHCRGGARNMTVGKARIPVSDFFGGYVPESYMHFLSYRLRDEEGERNGIINISVRVKEASGGKKWGSTAEEEGVRIPVAVMAGKSMGGGVVTGVPVWSSPSYPVKV